MTYLVSVYDCNLALGGREEGGWYYDTGSLVRTVRTFRNEQRAVGYCRKLNQRLKSRAFGPNRGKREYTSVLSDGEFRATVDTGHAPKYFPEVRPHYE